MPIDHRHHPSRWRRVGIPVLLVALLAVAVSQAGIREPLLALVGYAQRAMVDHPAIGAVLFLLLAAVSVMAAFFTSTILVPAALAVYGTAGTFALLWGGWIFGGFVAYTVGSTLGRPVVRALTSADALARYERIVTPKAPFALILLLQLALPSELPGYLLGLIRYPRLKYLCALALGELPYAIGTVSLARGVVSGRTSWVIGGGLAAVALTGIAYEVLHRRFATADASAASTADSKAGANAPPVAPA